MAITLQKLSDKYQIGGVWQSVFEVHNPFYLLSGLCMLVGCFMVASGLRQEHWPISQLLVLLLVFNVYEVLIIGVARWLVRWPGFGRDVGYLIVLELLLLLDVTFLYNECFTISLGIGCVVNSVAAVLAIIKIHVIRRIVVVPFTPVVWGLVYTLVVATLAMPGVFRVLGEFELVTPVTLYRAWWVVAVVPVVWALIPGWLADGEGDIQPTFGRVVCWGLAVLPYVSVLGHLRAANYVYDQPAYYANYAPVLIGVATLYAGRFVRSMALSPVLVVTALCLAGVVLSWEFSSGLIVGLDRPMSWQCSPLRAVLIAVVVPCGVAWWQTGAWYFVSAGSMSMVGAAAGHTGSAIKNSIHVWWSGGMDMARSLIPQSSIQWGVCTVVAAFILLALGVWMSCLRRFDELVESER